MENFKLALLFEVLALSVQCFNTESTQSVALTSHNDKDCPLWHYFDSNTRDCRCFPLWLVSCDGKENAFIEYGHILTCDDSKEILSLYNTMFYLSPEKYNITGSSKILLPENIPALNDFMCAPLNRKGYLCRDCLEGYGSTMFVSMCTDYVCYPCSESWYKIGLYLLLEFLPITVFYLIVLMLQIRMTSPPMTCFIMYSQLIIYALNKSCNEPLLNKVEFVEEKGTIRPISKIFLTLYGVFNLDFIRYAVTPFCISSTLKPIHVAFLGYVSAFYPFLLIMITRFCITLHDRNVRVVVFLWKPFHKCLVKIRNEWSTKTDLADAFASFFLLSYNKIMYQTLFLLNTNPVKSFSLLDDPTRNPSPIRDYVLTTDVSIMFGSTKFAIIITTTVLIFCVFNVLPALMITLYPIKKIRLALLSRCKPWILITLNTFVEKYHFCYRDGLDGGKDLRYFSGLYFFLRITVVLVVLLLSNIFRFETWLLRGIIFSIAALLVALCRPYKKTYANVLDTLLLFYLATLCHILSANTEFSYFVPVMQAIFSIPFLILIFAICFRLTCKIRAAHFAKCFNCLRAFVWCCVSSVKRFATTDANITADQERLVHPVYTYGTINN